MVSEQPTREQIACIADDESCDRPVVEVGISLDAFIEANFRALRHEIHVECAVGGHVVPFHELVHVECVAVTCHIEIIAGV